MKSIILLVALVALVAAAPTVDEPAKIIRSDFQQSPEGGYGFNFETEDGVQREETGSVKEVLDEEKKPHVVVVVRGSYKYPNPDGQFEIINYWADENGFKAEGDSVPKNPARR